MKRLRNIMRRQRGKSGIHRVSKRGDMYSSRVFLGNISQELGRAMRSI